MLRVTAKDLWAAQASRPGDGAFDRSAEGFDRALAQYVRSRSLADLEKVPRLPGKGLTLFRLRQLTAEERSSILALVGDARQQATAFRLACHEVQEGAELAAGEVKGGASERARCEGDSKWASDEWMDGVQSAFGGDLISEMGALIIQRASVSPRDLDPFGLPYGLRPAR